MNQSYSLLAQQSISKLSKISINQLRLPYYNIYVTQVAI